MISGGFLHGFVVRKPNKEVQHECCKHYAHECVGAVRRDSVDIDWGAHVAPVLSKKDAAALTFGDFISPFTYEGDR